MRYCIFWSKNFIAKIEVNEVEGIKMYNCFPNSEGMKKATANGMPKFYALAMLNPGEAPSFLVERIENDPDFKASSGRCATDKFILKKCE